MQGLIPRLRVLALYDENYKTVVAYCLETGSVVTGDDPVLLKDEMRELLEDEISFAIKTRNFANLFSSPAPFEIWEKYQEAEQTHKPEQMELFAQGRKGVTRVEQIQLARAA